MRSRFFTLLFVALVTMSFVSNTPVHADNTIVYVDEVYYSAPTLVEKTDSNGVVSFRSLGSACPTQGQSDLMATTFGGFATDWTYAEDAWAFNAPEHRVLKIVFGSFDTSEVLNFANARRHIDGVLTTNGRWRCASGLLEPTQAR